MPNVVGAMLAESDVKDLGMHTELCGDAYLKLYEAGKLTNRCKTLLPGRGLTGIVFGSKELYDWVDDNPAVAAAPLSYVNDPKVIAQNDKLISVNNCIAVDLYGQISSESSGLRQISGTGGQLDYLTGAAMSRGGRAFASRGTPSLSAASSRACAVRRCAAKSSLPAESVSSVRQTVTSAP